MLHKEILRECGRLTRDELQRLDPLSPFVRCSMLESIARAVWFRDRRLAELILNNSHGALEYLSIVEGAPTLTSQVRFNNEVVEAKRKRIDMELDYVCKKDDNDICSLGLLKKEKGENECCASSQPTGQVMESLESKTCYCRHHVRERHCFGSRRHN